MEIISREDAARKGLRFYFTGRSCRKGHRSLRYTLNGQCKQCAREFHAKNYLRIKGIVEEARRQDAQT